MSFNTAKAKTDVIRTVASDSIQYDLLGKIVSQTLLTRKTAATILKGISPIKFAMFAQNFEDFINKVSNIINGKRHHSLLTM